MTIRKIGSNNFNMPKKKERTITDYIRNVRTVRDMDFDDANEYRSRYGRHGTLGRNKRKSPREFLKEKYGQK